jgi:hypothetical protein
MQSGADLVLWLMVLGGSVIAAFIAIMILKKMGRVDLSRNAQRQVSLDEARRANPRLAALPVEQQQRIADHVRWHPLIIIWLVAGLGGFVWIVLTTPVLFDFINLGWRSAGLTGGVTVVVLLGGMMLIRRVLIARALAAVDQ